MAITREACHAKEIIQQAFEKYGLPEIVNTDTSGLGYSQRAHSSLDRSTPHEAYIAGLPKMKLAA